MNRQEYYRQQYALRKPGWRHSLFVFRDVMDSYLRPDARVLDIGCGHADFLAPVYARSRFTCGLDPDKQALDKNTTVRERIAGIAGALPLCDGVYDVVTSVWLCEHLDVPERAFREMHRVLKPGGHVVFLTPNAWNYNTWLIRLTPHALHDLLARKLHGRQAHDTYPVRYRFNTLGVIDRTLSHIGFDQCKIIFHGDPTYVSFNRPLFELACAVERLFDLPPLHPARVHLIGVYQKQKD
ncbi:MAG: class I SAM-dependent methyltransferase [Chloroflexi bacterium]|nr:class I SAM-dependent methyltransferase [Chloroflexota bacterium]